MNLIEHQVQCRITITRSSLDMTTEIPNIDTTGSSVGLLPNGKIQITLDKRVTARAFKEVISYLYQDKVEYV